MISVIVPVFACAPLSKILVERICSVLRTQDFEVVVVVDGLVTDWNELVAWRTQFMGEATRVRLLRLARNYGQHAAIMAGIANANGDVLIVMDGDLQDPPELIPDFLDTLGTGVPLVLGRQLDDGRRRISWRRVQSKAYASFVRYFLGSMVRADETNFVAMTRAAAESVAEMDEPGAHFLHAVHATGLEYSWETYRRNPRPSGNSGYTFLRRIKHATSDVTFLSGRPLVVAFWVGALQAVFALGLVGILIARYISGSETPSGWLALMTVILTQGALVSAILGTLGLYVRAAVSTSRRVPRFRVAERY